jgi:hypothetical protein
MMLATVIPLPGPKSDRVTQTRGPGRLPKSVAALWKSRSEKSMAQYQAQETAKKLAAKRLELEFLRGKMIEVQLELKTLQGAGNGR